MSNECSTCLLRIDPLDELPTSALASREARSDSPDWPARIRDRLTPDRAAAAGCARIDVLRRKCLPASEPLRLRCVIFARTVEPIGGLHLAGRTWRDLSLLCRRGARARPRQTTAVSPLTPRITSLGFGCAPVLMSRGRGHKGRPLLGTVVLHSPGRGHIRHERTPPYPRGLPRRCYPASHR
jgi:hypothetical protein